jgi:hypothetical protein
VPKGHTSHLRVAVSEWRGEHKLELHECTRVVGEVVFPSRTPITLNIDKIGQLIELLQKAVRP